MKKFICGVIAGVIISTTTTAFAIGEKDITAVMGKIGIKVNDIPITEETLLYNGTTYVPLRAISTMLGADVDYDAETRTALIYSENFGVAPVPESHKRAKAAVEAETTTTTTTATTKRMTKDEYENKKSQIEKDYENRMSEIRDAWKEINNLYTTGRKVFEGQDLSDQIEKLKKQERDYANAVTITGQNHHDEIVQQLKQYEALQAIYEYDWNNIKSAYKDGEAAYKEAKAKAEETKKEQLEALEKEYGR